MSEAKIELLRETLDMLILKVVALGACRSYATAQGLQQLSNDFLQVQQGSLHRALHRLEDRDWLQPEWKESETGREAKFYSLIKKGHNKLATEAANWKSLCDAIGLFFRAAGTES